MTTFRVEFARNGAAVAAPAERANALSLSNPGAAAAVQEDTRLATMEVISRAVLSRPFE